MRKDAMWHVFIMIVIGFIFAMLGLGNIYIALAWHKSISEPFQWLCLTFFVTFVFAGVFMILYEAVRCK
jgi:RsiW-degrading membrane proteinase PrsW (M82 family)